MSGARNEAGWPRGLVLAFWVLFFLFVPYVLLTVLLASQRGGTLLPTLIFGDVLGDVVATAMVAFYLALDPAFTWYFYRRALGASAEKSYAPELGSVVVGVAAPYLYALLVSFMGLMRDVFPVLYIGFFYIVGVVVGLRIIPTLVVHIKSE